VASTSSTTGGAQVASYVQALVGAERVTSRMRIQTLAAMAAQGVDVPGFTNPLSPKTEADPQVTPRPLDDSTRMVSAPSKVSQAPRKATLVLAVLVGVLLSAGVATFLRLQTPNPPVPAPVPVAGPTTPVVDPPKPPVPAVIVRDTPPADPPNHVNRDRDPPTKPKRLEQKDVERLLGSYQRQVYPCFVDHREELPSENGMVRFMLTILGSGKVVNAKVTGDLAGTRVGECVEKKISALKFPRNVDSEITLNSGYTYSLK
jgi:hypothetical protein